LEDNKKISKLLEMDKLVKIIDSCEKDMNFDSIFNKYNGIKN
jgi:hypothetical protein